mmetsp:Transcript_32414/g.36276  ORF Transcript_32414/g.36276 Transcript_32414/m.36276 type:complete len:83 (-) Transcript_32414:387-635(-)|eukprot:CAMPEP_0170811328 /NCGR_PEP_ID=MMETSP0733-20121128/35196_1 /TAXON_ID=186038 /ORGANISM="Fragilariopsis kerguelensis, Strain L26-C5" /LENGTH=82 /DNA_ID=CAMNT_0011167471 /DNA_START=218 /DNA_END=466 /DNA_ORIENTATION=-
MGCQMNLADSENIEGQLQSIDIRRLDLLMTSVESKVYSYLVPYAKRKRDGEDVAIVVVGCVAQQEGEALLRRVPEVDLVMGP